MSPRRAPTQARSKQRVARILDAAAAIVDRRGLDAVTTNAIADEAALPVGTLYQFFPNREAVLHALLERQLDALDARFAPLLGPARDDVPVEAAVDAVVSELATAYVELPALAALVQGLRADPRFAAVTAANNRRVAGWIAALLRRRNPRLRPSDARAAATALVEATDGILQTWLRLVRARRHRAAAPLLMELRLLAAAYLRATLARAA